MVLLDSISLLFRLFFAVTFAYVFIASGLIVSLVCLILTLLLWPCAKTTYRKVVCWLGYSVLGQMVWLCKDWATLDVVLFGEPSTYEQFGKESGLLICSHRGDLDWVAGFIVGMYYNFLHAIRSLPKRSIIYVPGFGQLVWALEYPFLKRNYATDQNTIAKFSDIYNKYPYPIQVAIFCEGTRYTVEKHKLAMKYAQEKGLPVLKHHLVPRTKGFAVLAEHFKPGGKFTAVYDIGFAYRNWPGKYLPSFLDMLLGRKVELLYYMRRFPMESLPEGHEKLQRFCYQLFEDKDKAYEYFLKHNTFPGPQQPIPPHSRKLWFLRFNALFWVVVTCVIPTFTLFCTLSWSSLFLFSLGVTLFNGVVLLGLLKYAYGGDIPTDTPHTDDATTTDVDSKKLD